MGLSFSSRLLSFFFLGINEMMPCPAVADRKHSDFKGVVDATDYRALFFGE